MEACFQRETSDAVYLSKILMDRRWTHLYFMIFFEITFFMLAGIEVLRARSLHVSSYLEVELTEYMKCVFCS